MAARRPAPPPPIRTMSCEEISSIVGEWLHNISALGRLQASLPILSRQSEKFLNGQSRKFRLTAIELRKGTNRDVPTGSEAGWIG